MVDIFISYSRTNQPVVRRLAEAVKAEGYSVWWDDELPPHLSYGDVITAKIGEARAAIVVWSEDAAASEWVRAEADVARNQKKLIQTSIDGRMPPMPFNQIQFAAIGDWHGEPDHPGWLKVKASLVALCGPRTPNGAPVPSPPPPPAPVSGISYDPAKGARVSMLVPLLIGALVLLLLAVGYLLMSRGGEAPAPSANVAVPSTEAAPQAAVASERFPARATVQYGPADLYGGADGAGGILRQLESGQAVETYPQEGEWWRVRLADGTTGSVSRRQLRLAGEDGRPTPAPTPAPAPTARPKAAAPPAPAPEEVERPSRAEEAALRNPRAVRRYCNGPGRGTSECQELRARYGR